MKSLFLYREELDDGHSMRVFKLLVFFLLISDDFTSESDHDP